ncbi:chymotrypsin-2-like [Anthonomus grandis grandis]|uniref:chymotrypsin-2-like n=1 Tax=Anthonomus grandis grandis TaxID=2921223 RepID=UPI002165E52D|nr:chymotrypsin-2-like [Anthonomus grandis grandis]
MKYFLTLSVLIVFVQLTKQAALENRIVNGEKVSINKYPYQVFVLNDRQGCGGSIISKKCILTAGHCVIKPDKYSEKTWVKQRPEEISITPGKSTIDHINSDILVEKINLHPNFKATCAFINGVPSVSDMKNDIAIIVLKDQLEYSKKINKISLPPQGESESLLYGKTAIATGYGMMSNNERTEDLHAVKLTIPDADILCDDSENICLPKQDNQRGICAGDSGGPLVINGVQYGITSGRIYQEDKPLCQFSTGFTFVNLIHYRQWISENSNVDEE